ncbi:MAG TPA: hypothetical protein PKB15_08115, partial [Acidimicrobiia bacterium]|nr:hypothetical protein [Acidimicrobiia bacterium]
MTSDLENIFIRHRATIHRTPSPHNTQPWTINFDDNALIIGFNSSRTLPVTDPTNRDLCLSLGMFIESIATVVGEETGKSINVAFRTQDDASAVCDIFLSDSDYIPVITSDDLKKRSTNRKVFATNTSDRESNIEQLLDTGGCPYILCDSRSLAPLLDQADVIQMANTDASVELNHWLRAEKTLRSRDGLSSVALDLRYFEAILLKAVFSRTIHRVLKHAGLAQALLRSRTNMLDTDSLLVAFTSEYEP